MEKFSFFLCALLLILCPFGVVGHATHNFEPIPANLFNLGHWDYYTLSVEWAVSEDKNIADMNSESGFKLDFYCRNDGIDPGSETAQDHY